MRFKRLASAVCAVAMAASVMAGLAVTASAAEPGTYSKTVQFAATNRITNNNDGTFKTASNAGNQYALALADLSGIDGISDASTVTVEFDSVISVNPDKDTGQRWLIGLGDKDTRGTTAGSSSKSGYDIKGLMLRFGTNDGKNYRVNGVSNIEKASDVRVHAKVTLDRAAGTYSYELTDGETELASATNVATSVEDLTVVEAYSWANSQPLTLSDVTVSYTIVDAEPISYTINAVADETVLETVASGTTAPSLPFKVSGIKEVVEKDGVFYRLSDSDVSSYRKSFKAGTEAFTGTVSYTKTTDIVYFTEAETLSTNTNLQGNENACSGGKYAAMPSSTKASERTVIETLPTGAYKVSVYLADRADRCVYIRDHNKTTTDDGATITNFGIGKTSATGKIYTAEFVLAQETTLDVSGYTSNDNNGNPTAKTNQSAGIDYIIIEKLPDPVVTATYAAGKLPDTLTGLTAVTPDADVADITAGAAATTYTIAVENYIESMGTPKLVINGEDAQATRTDTTLKYYYTEGGKAYFIYQVIGEIDHANSDTVSLTGAADVKATPV